MFEREIYDKIGGCDKFRANGNYQLWIKFIKKVILLIILEKNYLIIEFMTLVLLIKEQNNKSIIL